MPAQHRCAERKAASRSAMRKRPALPRSARWTRVRGAEPGPLPLQAASVALQSKAKPRFRKASGFGTFRPSSKRQWLPNSG
eukprot:6385753-Prymnesium_polylepis.2